MIVQLENGVKGLIFYFVSLLNIIPSSVGVLNLPIPVGSQVPAVRTDLSQGLKSRILASPKTMRV